MDHIDIAEQLKTIRARNAEVSATTVLKTESLRVVLIVLKPGGEMREHHADGRIILQVLEGKIEFSTEGTQRQLEAGVLTSVEALTPHSVRALKDSVVLLTIAWREPEPAKPGAHRNTGYE